MKVKKLKEIQSIKGNYNTGATYPLWAIATAYSKGNRVIYKGAVMEIKNRS
jgi:hypothetical protein